jgi:hypothetical protein
MKSASLLLIIRISFSRWLKLAARIEGAILGFIFWFKYKSSGKVYNLRLQVIARDTLLKVGSGIGFLIF